jgi:hypothetical protein
LKAFHAKFFIDDDAIAREEATYKSIPIKQLVTPEIVQLNYNKIKSDIQTLVDEHLAYMMETPELSELVVKKRKVQHAQRPNSHL